MTCEFCRKWTAQSRVVLEAQLAMLSYKPEGMPLCPRCKTREWARSAEGLIEEPEARSIDWIVVLVVLVLVTAVVLLALVLYYWAAMTPSNTEVGDSPTQVVVDLGSLNKGEIK